MRTRSLSSSRYCSTVASARTPTGSSRNTSSCMAAGGSASPADLVAPFGLDRPLDRHLARSVCRAGRLARRSRETGSTGRAVASARAVHPTASSAASRRRLAVRGRVLGRPDSTAIGLPASLPRTPIHSPDNPLNLRPDVLDLLLPRRCLVCETAERCCATTAAVGYRRFGHRSARAAARRRHGPSPAAASAPAEGSPSPRPGRRSRTTPACAESSRPGRSAACAARPRRRRGSSPSGCRRRTSTRRRSCRPTGAAARARLPPAAAARRSARPALGAAVRAVRLPGGAVEAPARAAARRAAAERSPGLHRPRPPTAPWCWSTTCIRAAPRQTRLPRRSARWGARRGRDLRAHDSVFASRVRGKGASERREAKCSFKSRARTSR